MAGHPNDASPLGLRNIGFTLHMGGDDAAYDRNKVAAQWKTKLADLQEADPEGYQHEVVIHQGKGHWMDREDAVAIPWMAAFVRNTTPSRIVWRQSGVTHHQFYWLAVDDQNRKAGSEVVATIKDQTINIERAEKLEKLTVRLNDQMLELDQTVTINVDGVAIESGAMKRTIGTLFKTLQERGDRELMFSAETTITLPR